MIGCETRKIESQQNKIERLENNLKDSSDCLYEKNLTKKIMRVV